MAETKKSGDDRVIPSDPLQEALRRIQDAEGTGAEELDLSNLALGPVLGTDWSGWQTLGRLDNLKILNLGNSQISAIPLKGWEALGELVGLSTLVLAENQLTTIPAEGWQALRRLAHLRQLFLQNNRIVNVPAEGWQTLGRLTNLSFLFLYGNSFAIADEGWDALGQLTNLKLLPLTSIRIGKASTKGWDVLSRLTELEMLLLVRNDLGDIPPEGWDALGRLTNLETLYVMSNGLTTVPVKGWKALSRLAKLENLGLSSNEIGDIPPEGWETLGRLSSLKELLLARNNITAVPPEGWEALSRLAKLEKLDISGNQISDIPLKGWGRRGRFPNLKNLLLSDNPLPEEVLAAASRGPRSLFEYLEAASLRAAHPRTVKLMLLGEPASGKTTLVEALRGNSKPCDPNRPETIGVNVQSIEKKSPQDGHPLYLATWDFAGQHMEYATHQFFLRPGAIYLIVWKARLGSDYGQRDLWYWLELLRMRVKDPEFLLVTTHTGSTPGVLDLLDVQASYPGCKGHFELELSNGTGLAALEKRILELAVASSSLKAAWPAPWLAVRDAIREMRVRNPYITAEAFWNLCADNEVAETRAQRDLGDQLDKLGEIVYSADDPLSRFVILDPRWLTELVAKVIRDKQVRDQGGTLTPADLDRIWGELPGAVRNHVENLMDEYDLVYKTPVHQHTQASIVVEALPPAPEEIRSLDITAGRPQTEMIYRFPSLVRHLPPGVPTWAFARSRRYLKPGTPLWRNAARFEDADTNSEAIVLSSEVDREVRLRVAADYPPYFIGVLDGILRDTFKRYPGAQPENLIPCPCQPACKHGHKRETVLKRKRDGKTDVSCPLSGEDVAIAKLLEGFAAVDTEAGVLAALATMRRQLSAILNGQNQELVKMCPSMFTLAPAKDFKLLDTYLEYATHNEELELTLYCEWEKEWHATQYSIYRFRPEQEWFGSLKTQWSEFLNMTKSVAPLAGLGGGLVGAPAVGAAVKQLAESAEKLGPLGEKDPTSALTRDLGLREQRGAIALEARHLLSRLIKHLDEMRGETQPEFGGLHPYHLKEDGRLLWLCAEHWAQYESTR